MSIDLVGESPGVDVHGRQVSAAQSPPKYLVSVVNVGSPAKVSPKFVVSLEEVGTASSADMSGQCNQKRSPLRWGRPCLCLDLHIEHKHSVIRFQNIRLMTR